MFRSLLPLILATEKENAPPVVSSMGTLHRGMHRRRGSAKRAMESPKDSMVLPVPVGLSSAVTAEALVGNLVPVCLVLQTYVHGAIVSEFGKCNFEFSNLQGEDITVESSRAHKIQTFLDEPGARIIFYCR